MNTLRKTIVLTATGVASFLILGLAAPETTPDHTPVAYGNAARTAPQKAPALTPDDTPEEDDPTWNCWTDGNRSCGTLPQVTQELSDALAEGEDADATSRNWELCVYAEGDTTYIYCPDGYTQSS